MTTNGITVTIRNITIMVALCILIAFAFGCSHLHVTNTTADGRTFEAVGWSLCYQTVRNKSFQRVFIVRILLMCVLYARKLGL